MLSQHLDLKLVGVQTQLWPFIEAAKIVLGFVVRSLTFLELSYMLVMLFIEERSEI